MEDIIVKRDMFNTYSKINLEEAHDLIMKHGYDYITAICNDAIIQIVFPMGGIKATEEQMRIELMNYLNHIIK